MDPPLRLCVCLVLIAACSARPNWHRGLFEKNDILIHQEEAHRESLDTLKNEVKIRPARQAPNPFFFNGRHPVGPPNFNNPHQRLPFPGQNFGPPLGQQFQQPGLHPIGQLGSQIQNIINSHLDATVQHNQAIHQGTLNPGFPQPPGFPHPPGRPLRPPPFCPSCTHHSHSHSFSQTSHFEFGRPQLIPGQHTHQIEINCPEGGTNCREIPVDIHPDPVDPLPLEPSKEPVTRPTTARTTTTEDYGKDSDIVFENGDQDSKTGDSEDNPGIDIRFGAGN